MKTARSVRAALATASDGQAATLPGTWATTFSQLSEKRLLHSITGIELDGLINEQLRL